ncbi:MAG: dephospho-CoA kinase [Thermoleophilia bacterium]
MTATPSPIPRLGLTGGIGSGKSTALAYLRELGAAVISSDDIVHGLYSRPDIVAAVRERYDAEVVVGDVVNRPALARIVFHDLEELQWLERLLHPHVRTAVAEFAAGQEAVAPRPALVVAEVPLLFETGFAEAFDYVVLITAPPDIRRRRLTAKLTASEFGRRLKQQMPEDEKIARSDFVFHNTGTRKELRDFVGETVAHVLAAAAGDGPEAAPGRRP